MRNLRARFALDCKILKEWKDLSVFQSQILVATRIAPNLGGDCFAKLNHDTVMMMGHGQYLV